MTNRPGVAWFWVGSGILLPIIVSSLLVSVRGEVANANLTLVLMAIVVLAALAGGRLTGAVAAVSAALSFDFFFTVPYLSLTMESQDDVESFVILLVVGLVVGHIAARARAARQEVRAGKTELGRIHAVADLLAKGAPADDVIFAAQRELTELMSLRSCRFEAAPFVTPYVRLERTGAMAATGERVRAFHLTEHGFELPLEGVELAVLSRGHPIGRFVLEPTAGIGASLEQRVVAVALADQVGAAIALQGTP